MRATIVVGAVAMVLAPFACTSKPLDATTLDQFVAQLCAELERCCTLAGLPMAERQCRDFYNSYASLGYEPAEAEPCLQELRALGDDKCRPTSSQTTPSCKRVFPSNVMAKPGEACQYSEDCAESSEGDVRCVRSSAADEHAEQCQLQLRGKKGSSPCVGNLRRDAIAYLGIIEPVPTEAYMCDEADGLTCDDSSRACKPLGAVGAECNDFDSGCILSAYCDSNDYVCKEHVALGGACEGSDWCESTAYCDNGTCAARRPSGETCTNDECINNCVNGTCQLSTALDLALLCGTN